MTSKAEPSPKFQAHCVTSDDHKSVNVKVFPEAVYVKLAVVQVYTFTSGVIAIVSLQPFALVTISDAP